MPHHGIRRWRQMGEKSKHTGSPAPAGSRRDLPAHRHFGFWDTSPTHPFPVLLPTKKPGKPKLHSSFGSSAIRLRPGFGGSAAFRSRLTVGSALSGFICSSCDSFYHRTQPSQEGLGDVGKSIRRTGSPEAMEDFPWGVIQKKRPRAGAPPGRPAARKTATAVE